MSDEKVWYGPRTDAYYERMRRILATTTVDTNRPIINRAEGIRFVDIDGNKGLDYTSQVGISGAGHVPEGLVTSSLAQSNNLIACLSNDFQFSSVHNQGYLKGTEVSPVKLAEELANVIPVAAPKKILFEVSGATAINAAVKLCLNKFRVNGELTRNVFVSFRKAFHGRHGPSLDLSNSKPVHKHLHMEGIKVVRLDLPLAGRNYDGRYWNELVEIFDGAEKRYGKLAAVFIEVVQGEGGINFASTKALGYLHRELERRGALFVVDEIQTGFGRTGKMFAIEHAGFLPDMLVFSKSAANGLPLGGVCFSEKVPDLEFGQHSGTMGGCPMSISAAQATLKEIKDNNLVANAAEVGSYLRAGLCKTIHGHDTDRSIVERVEGLGLMIAVEFRTKEKCHEFVLAALRQRPILLLIEAGEKTVRFMPPLCITQGEVDETMPLVKGALDSMNS